MTLDTTLTIVIPLVFVLVGYVAYRIGKKRG